MYFYQILVIQGELHYKYNKTSHLQGCHFSIGADPQYDLYF